jgi:hypothetical protein
MGCEPEYGGGQKAGAGDCKSVAASKVLMAPDKKWYTFDEKWDFYCHGRSV